VSPPSTIANPKALSWLFDHLTLEAHTSDWKQLYSTDVHGWGLDRLYEQTRLESPSIVLIHASPQRSADSDAADAAAAVDYRENESVFGFYTDVVLRPLKATGRVATTRLFQLFPEDARRSYAVQADAAQRVVGVMCSPEFLACGGSSTSAVAIRLHKGLTNVGATAGCGQQPPPHLQQRFTFVWSDACVAPCPWRCGRLCAFSSLCDVRCAVSGGVLACCVLGNRAPPAHRTSSEAPPLSRRRMTPRRCRFVCMLWRCTHWWARDLCSEWAHPPFIP